MVMTAEDSLKVFRMTQERVDAAMKKYPEFIDSINISRTITTTSFENDPSWNEEDYKKFRRDIKEADIVVGYMFPLKEIALLAPRLKWIHIIGAGIEHLLPLDWLPKGVILTNNRGAHAPKTYEYAMMALLMLGNHMPRLACAQRKHFWDGHFVSVIKGSKVAILGAGKQGSAVALAAKQLGMQTVGVDINQIPKENFDEILPPSELHKVLRSADYVVVTLPLVEDTFHFVGEREFSVMKKGAGFVNISRGKIVDNDALICSLEAGHISGAVLDVFEQEPLPKDSPLWSVPNLIISPHMGCDDEENYIDRTFDIVFQNLRRLKAGEALDNVIDIEKGY